MKDSVLSGIGSIVPRRDRSVTNVLVAVNLAANRKRQAERPAVSVAMNWLGILDSNQDYLIQSQAAYR